MTTYTQAQQVEGHWVLPENDVWNVPDEDLRFDMDFYPGPWRVIKSVKGMAKTLDGKVFGVRTLSGAKESGYCLEGKVSIGGKKYRGFTSSTLFKKDGQWVEVATIIVSNFDPRPEDAE
jgi:hypothetical protein